MKIGILTHHYVSNYGAYWQAFCLREAIAGLFPDAQVEIIDLINRKHLLINTGGFFRYFRGRENFAAWRQKLRQPILFAKARKAHMRLSKRVYSAREVNALGYDCIVVGSDEVWNYHDKKSVAGIKFGVGLEGSRLVSYAASVGGVTAFSDLPQAMREGLAKFSALSARDDHTAQMIETVLGKTPVRVLDPVLIGPVPGEETPRVQRLTSKPYLLFYHCAPLSENVRASIKEYAKKHGLRLLGAGEYDQLYDELSVDLTPSEWAQMFKKAEHVITGTFHGAVFSLIHSRQLTVCPNNQVRAEKLAALMRCFGLESRIIPPEHFDIVEQTAQKIDYAPVQAEILRLKSVSLSYLRAALIAPSGETIKP